MRLFSYNILNGGTGRADPLGEVIEANRPDSVALVEADDHAVVERIAHRLKMDFVIGQGERHAAALLTHWTIETSLNHAAIHGDFGGSLLEAIVVEPGGRRWPIVVTHLHAGAFDADEAERERQLAFVLAATKPHRDASSPHLLCGDFNSNAPTQQIDIARAHPKTAEAFVANGNVIPRRVVQRVLAAGYVDTLHRIAGNEADRTATFTTLHPRQRLDYIFAHGFPAGDLRAGWVEHDRLATYASDHYPIGVEIA